MKKSNYGVLALLASLLTVTHLTLIYPHTVVWRLVTTPPASADLLRDRLVELLPQLEQLKEIGGSAGVSIGVFRAGSLLLDHHMGYADVERRVVANASTRYTIGSLSKSFIAATVAHLIDGDSNLTSWDASVTKHVSDLTLPDAHRPMSFIDIMSHRTGLSSIDEVWLGADGETLVEKNATVRLCSHLPSLYPVRSKFIYNNWMYALVGEVIELVDSTHRPWGDIVSELTLQPLGLNQTTARAADLDGVPEAKPYMVLPDKTLAPVKHMPPLQGDVMGAAGGIRSTTHDMLRWGDNLLTRLADAASGANVASSFDMLFAGHSFLKSSSAVDELYGLGWAKVTLPAQFGKIGYNPGLVAHMPRIGTSNSGQQVFYHSGAITGYNTCIFLVPQTHTTIIVMTNSIAQGDVADWIGQALLQVVLDEKNAQDIVSYAEEAASNWLKQYADMKQELDHNRRLGTHAPAPADLVGRYQHTTGALFIRVFVDSKQRLRFSFGDRPDQEHTLTHYADDTFSFLPASDAERMRRGLFHYGTSAWLLHFKRKKDKDGKDSEEGHMQQIAWNIESQARVPETFTHANTGRS